MGSFSTAAAVPPDKIVYMQSGDILYIPAGQGHHWQARSSSAGVLEAKMAPAGEVFLQAFAKGQALVLVENRRVGRTAVWLVKVGEKEPAGGKKFPDLSRLPCSCSRSEPTEPFNCLVRNQECLAALRQALEQSDTVTSELWIRYDIAGSQILLRQIEERLAAEGFQGVRLALVGANLRLEGKLADESERARLLFALYRSVVGKLVIDDRLQLEKVGNPATVPELGQE